MAEEVLGEKKALDLSGEMPLVEGLEADEELLLARDLMRSFVKSIKAFRFYPPDNPILKGFKELVPKKFNFFLNKYNSLIFQIGEYDLSFKGKVLYENRDVKTSLAFLFFKDGLRELRFMKGLEEWEVQGLIDIIAQSEHIDQLDGGVTGLRAAPARARRPHRDARGGGVRLRRRRRAPLEAVVRARPS